MRIIRYLRHRWVDRYDHDDSPWLLFAALAAWLFLVWWLCFFPE